MPTIWCKYKEAHLLWGAEVGDSEAEDDEKPAHQVTLNSFYVCKYEVTQALWKAVMGNNPSRFKGDNLPVENVELDDCLRFIRILNTKTGKHYRLLTEAEWEFAARGGNSSRGYKFSGSNSLDEVAWYNRNSNMGTHPVGSKSPNELGLYDMSGNVEEWCSDRYAPYSSNSQTNTKGPVKTDNLYRVLRGGSWHTLSSVCRVSYRNRTTPTGRYETLGLRLACD